jgi:ubiquitin carboxyl-terminal hydrolase 8
VSPIGGGRARDSLILDGRNCPHCKTLRRATKQLSLSRLPPVLLIHLKRFSSKGASADKIETFVDFPVKGLDLTNYMPPPLPPGVDSGVPGAQQLSMDDPRRQFPPYKYDLYAVTNHFGSLSSGHCEWPDDEVDKALLVTCSFSL